MNVAEEMVKLQIIEDIKKFVMGVTIEPNMQLVENNLIERCNSIGLNYAEWKEKCKIETPTKRTYSEIIKDTQIEGIDRGLSIAFETLLRGEELDTRELDDQIGKQSYSNGFSKEHRYMCKMDILRTLCISLKNDTIGYNGIDLEVFLNEKGINPNLQITEEQLDYIHSLNLSNLEDFSANLDISLLPQQLVDSTDIWGAMDKKGGSLDYLYRVQNKNAYRIYINTPQKSDRTDSFLTDYIKMCIGKKIPYAIKGSQDKGEEAKDNTVLYISEENLLDYIQILDELSVLHPETVATFGEPPLLTQGLSNNGKNSLENWFGFADLGQDGAGTYNDRTKFSSLNAFMATLYETMPYETKRKIQENGFSLKALSSVVKFEPSYCEQTLKSTGRKIRKAVFPRDIDDSEKGLKTPLESDGRLRINNTKIIRELISLCKKELSQILQDTTKKQAMFEKFKKYYVLMENYFKYNSPKNEHSMEYTFEDYRGLPTTVPMSLYQKYKQELINNREKQEIIETEGKSFLQVFQEAFREEPSKNNEQVQTIKEVFEPDEIESFYGNLDENRRLSGFQRQTQVIKTLSHEKTVQVNKRLEEK